METKQLIKVSIIIPNYNGLRYIKGCLDSLAKQLFQSFEIIIVDNASQDGSREYISENYPQIKLISLNQNYGFSKAVNEGIKASNCEYVVLLNNDTEVEKYWLKNLANCIEKDKKIFSCCSKMVQFLHRDKIDDVGDEYTILGWAYKRGDGAILNRYTKSERVFSSCAGAAIYRRNLFEEIGYFDEDFFAYMEDVDISYRANVQGYKNVYCSNAVVYHIGSATSGSKYNSFKVRLAARNNIYVFLKNMPFFQLLINSPFLFIGWVIKYLFFYKKGFSKEFLEGSKEAFNSLEKIGKVKYKNKNLKNYFVIEIVLIGNTFKYLFSKMTKGKS
ncbi:glycosyltransferase family 2 protein [Clostridium estertheticum]|uniref:glycosyltransferase family 2 protein n=1 Tax=Clostridium estertheticum TaxID=238834 RepID=UPI001C7DEB66|nr:glycosyltransferase family 2 protein [Clostridium estertheticum]MBX4258436.1 glycosyltransferase family 2 protein [Clostridium estertheticum]WLC69611.1 glycosyltransferase family 2 protein [Clostridium estertheticum]